MHLWRGGDDSKGQNVHSEFVGSCLYLECSLHTEWLLFHTGKADFSLLWALQW